MGVYPQPALCEPANPAPLRNPTPHSNPVPGNQAQGLVQGQGKEAMSGLLHPPVLYRALPCSKAGGRLEARHEEKGGQHHQLTEAATPALPGCLQVLLTATAAWQYRAVEAARAVQQYQAVEAARAVPQGQAAEVLTKAV